MAAVQVGINGFGRIGRIAFRAMLERYGDSIEIVAVNDLTDTETNAHLLRYDSNYGHFKGEVTVGDGSMTVNGRKITVLAERDPAKIPWGDLGVDVVLESTGFFTDGTRAAAHLQGGAKKVIISAPAKNEDLTVVMGVNHTDYDPSRHHVISNASCTTNCLAPVARVLVDRFGIEKGMMSTVHSATNDQRVADQAHEDLRRARSITDNIIPTSTGAARAISLVVPELKGKMHGSAFRVPTKTVSLVDLSVVLSRDVTAEELNAAFQEAADGAMQGVLGVSHVELTSIDYKGNPLSSIVDAPSTLVVGGNLAKVLSWYDNEYGYSCRVADLANYLVSRAVGGLRAYPDRV
ncbi:MAG: type I glyceraldehyde-3-phosphate dehydrogenase [Armatimonadetes bacterium]|nr:type I glyceraldehyde-3-phosphate dehydrogenase [Armatimonadota bacterium]